MWPLHSWLPDAHTAAPTVGSVLLAGVLLKMGTYGFVRIVLPDRPRRHAHLRALPRRLRRGRHHLRLPRLPRPRPRGAGGDLKRLIAYSSVGHMGFVLLGIATLTPTGVNGALFANIAHGLITGLLFFLVGALKDRYGTTDLDTLSGASGAALTAGRRASAACSPSPPSPPSGCPDSPGSGARCSPCSAPSTPPPGSAARPTSPSWRSPASAPCSPPPTCSSSYGASAWATPTRAEPARGPPSPTSSGYEFAAWTPLVALTVLAGLWPAVLLGLTDPAVQQLLAGGNSMTTARHGSPPASSSPSTGSPIAPPTIAAVAGLAVLVADLFLPSAEAPAGLA